MAPKKQESNPEKSSTTLEGEKKSMLIKSKWDLYSEYEIQNKRQAGHTLAASLSNLSFDEEKLTPREQLLFVENQRLKAEIAQLKKEKSVTIEASSINAIDLSELLRLVKLEITISEWNRVDVKNKTPFNYRLGLKDEEYLKYDNYLHESKYHKSIKRYFEQELELHKYNVNINQKKHYILVDFSKPFAAKEDLILVSKVNKDDVVCVEIKNPRHLKATGPQCHRQIIVTLILRNLRIN